MYNNYPPGAANDPNAPYNQHDPELICEIITRELEDGELCVEVSWTADGKEWIGDDTVEDYFDLQSTFYLDAEKFQSYTDDELCEYIENL